MGRFTAMAVHLSVCLVGGVLYFLFVLPRWWELMGDVSHTLGTVLRIVTGVVIALAAVPVLLTLIRTRKPELATPRLALRMRQWSMILHVTAGALIAATAVAEIWVSLDTAGPWLFGVYGAAAALAILGMLAFYLAFVAEKPPKPPKEKKPRRKRGKKADEALAEETTDSDEALAEETTDSDESLAEETTESDETGTNETPEASETDDAEEPVEDEDQPAEVSAEAPAETPAEAEPEPEADSGGLRNKRPSGKTSHRLRRRNRGGVALDD